MGLKCHKVLISWTFWLVVVLWYHLHFTGKKTWNSKAECFFKTNTLNSWAYGIQSTMSKPCSSGLCCVGQDIEGRRLHFFSSEASDSAQCCYFCCFHSTIEALRRMFSGCFQLTSLSPWCTRHHRYNVFYVTSYLCSLSGTGIAVPISDRNIFHIWDF